MRITLFAIAALFALAAPVAPALAASTLVFAPVADDSLPTAPQARDDQDQRDDAYDAVARFVRDARFEVAKSITVGENPTLDPFVESIGRGGQERSSLGDFRLPPNARQMLEDGGGGSLLGLFTLSNVPEPSQWMMMVLGLGLIGGGLRYRRAARKIVAASQL